MKSKKSVDKRVMIRIEKIIENKKQFLDLLLLADEQENMIDKYLPSGDLFALYDDDLKSYRFMKVADLKYPIG